MTEKVTVDCNASWSAAQMADAYAKFEVYAASKLVVTTVDRSIASVMQRAFRKAFLLSPGIDADHFVELVLGGDPWDLWQLDSSVNRSSGRRSATPSGT